MEKQSEITVEVFTITPELRWKVDGHTYSGEFLGMMQKEEVLVLQQKWIGDSGTVRWEDVPIVKEDHE